MPRNPLAAATVRKAPQSVLDSASKTVRAGDQGKTRADRWSSDVTGLRESSQHVRTAPPEPPVIRVTIGRVEVRAVAPPARRSSQPSASPRRPALTLESYLKQRNEGGG